MNGVIKVSEWLESLKITGIKPLLRKLFEAKSLDTRMARVDDIINLLQENNVDYDKAVRNLRHNERYKNDIIYRLECNVRGSLNKAFKRNGYKKTSKSFVLIGCSFEELKINIEIQFKEGMSWSNHGEWHIDHKIPLSWAKTEEQLKELCKYTNLQPLWAEENLSKKNYYANV